METEAPPSDNTQAVDVQTVNAQSGQTTTASVGEFGTSDYGQRLNYSDEKPKYQDLWAMILFYVHIVAIIVAGIILWTTSDWDPFSSPTSTTTTTTTSSSSSTTRFSSFTPTPTLIRIQTPTRNPTQPTPAPTLSPAAKEFVNTWVTDIVACVIISLVIGLVVGLAFGVLWLQCMKKFAEQMIKIILFGLVLMWVVVCIVIFATLPQAPAAAIVPAIFLLFTLLYTWCVWSRIPFSGVCLSIASKVVQTYPGTIYTSIAAVIMNWLWCDLWVGCVGRAYADPMVNNFVKFLLAVSYFWGLQVWRNVSHTTICGVTATWYFNPGKLVKPSSKAFKRAMTTSFGSICFGSLIIAFLQAIRTFARSGGRTAHCIVLCIERIMRYFNSYAYCQVAIYGSSFIEAAKATWELFLSQGLMAIIKDQLSGMVLFVGSMIAGLIAGCATFGVSYAFGLLDASKYSLLIFINLLIVIVLVFFALMLGFFACANILTAVSSSVVAVFVCFAEDPLALNTNRPDDFQRLVGASEGLTTIATGKGIVIVQPPAAGGAADGQQTR